MALPRKLKNMNLFNEGRSYLAEVPSVTLPKLTRKLEEYRGGGMDGTVKLDMGAEAMEMEFTAGGPLRDVLLQTTASAIGLSSCALPVSIRTIRRARPTPSR